MVSDISEHSQPIEISGSQLTIAQVVAVARHKRRVRLSEAPEVRKKIVASRQILEEKLRRGEIIYGVNTGLGGNVRFILPAEDLAKHQKNIFLKHELTNLRNQFFAILILLYGSIVDKLFSNLKKDKISSRYSHGNKSKVIFNSAISFIIALLSISSAAYFNSLSHACSCPKIISFLSRHKMW